MARIRSDKAFRSYAVLLYANGRYDATPLGPTSEARARRFVATPPKLWRPGADEELIMVRVERVPTHEPPPPGKTEAGYFEHLTRLNYPDGGRQ